jgi:hypothetical protein
MITHVVVSLVDPGVESAAGYRGPSARVTVVELKRTAITTVMRCAPSLWIPAADAPMPFPN